MEDIAKAIHTDDMGLLKSALSRVDPNARDPKMGNAAPINIAAFMGKKDAIETILAAGASPNTQDERGATPLILAVVNGHVDVVGVLLRARADTNIKDQKGACPIILASFNGDIKLVEMLLDARAQVTHFFFFLWEGRDCPILVSRCHRGLNQTDGCSPSQVTVEDGEGQTPLNLAIKNANGLPPPSPEKMGAKVNTSSVPLPATLCISYHAHKQRPLAYLSVS